VLKERFTMEFMVACNWELDLLDKINYPEVKTLFGGLPGSLIASGRSPSFMSIRLSHEEIRDYIRRVHEKGWSFDYNINSTCLSNKEFTASGHKEILKYIESILELGVDSLTVGLPSLMEIINKHFPGTKMKVSTYQKVDSVAKAQRFEELGADVIMLSEHINRDFNLLRAIRNGVKSKLALIANVGCTYECPNMHSHANSIAHSCAAGEKYSVFSEFYQANCLLNKIKDPVEFVKSRWIRPEDVKVYEDVGIDMLKILERNNTSDTLGERVKAYSMRSYEGNLIDMLGQMSNRKRSLSLTWGTRPQVETEDFKKIKRFLETFFKTSIPDLFYLDNKKIPKDFIHGFMNRDCSKLSCKKCNYCKDIADVCISQVDPEEINRVKKLMIDYRDEIIEGSALC
jgi:collagenase-like PrtC family protease